MSYTNIYKLSASILLLSIFLQSCGGGNNPTPLIQDGQSETLSENTGINHQNTSSSALSVTDSDTHSVSTRQIEKDSQYKQIQPISKFSKKEMTPNYNLKKPDRKEKSAIKKTSEATRRFQEVIGKESISAVNTLSTINSGTKTRKISSTKEGNETLYKLGIAHYYGIDGVKQSYQKAFECFIKAAQSGHAQAQYKLGIMFSRGDNVELNYQEAAKWLEKAANQRDYKAQYEFAMLLQNQETYADGKSKKYMQWLEESAQQEYEPAQNQLGLLRRLSSLVVNSEEKLWEQFFLNLGATNCWEELRSEKADLYFKLSKIDKIDLDIDQYDNVIRAIFHYIICHKLSIQSLSIQKQRIRIPSSIRQLLSLKKLDLSYTLINELPDSIGELIQLEELQLYANQFRLFPPVIANLTNLQRLDLSYNKLNNIPTSIKKLINLKALFLQGNSIESIPNSIGELTEIKELNLSNNCLKGIPDTLFNLYNNKNSQLSLRANPFFKSDDLYPLTQQTLKNYAYSQLPCSLRTICANAVLKYAGRIKSNEKSRKGILKRTWKSLSSILFCEELPQSIYPGFEENNLGSKLPAELSLDNLQILSDQTALGQGNKEYVIFFKNINGQEIPCYLSYKLFGCQNVGEILQKVKDENLKCYLTIS
ncbi:MAG: hypothetical protein ACYC2U_01280 [Candidatus Amoebophilus sp.]